MEPTACIAIPSAEDNGMEMHLSWHGLRDVQVGFTLIGHIFSGSSGIEQGSLESGVKDLNRCIPPHL